MERNPQRRDLFATIVKGLDELRSINHGEPHYKRLRVVDSVLEHGSEVASLWFSLEAAIEGAKNKLTYVDVAPLTPISKSPNLLESGMGSIHGLEAGQPRALEEIRELKRMWRDEFYKSKTEVYFVYTDDGPEMRSRVVYYWDEPHELTTFGIDHEIIDSWEDQVSQQINLLNNLEINFPNSSNLQYDHESYNFETKVQNQDTVNNIRLVAFSTSGLAFCFYEEIAQLISESNGDPGLITHRLADEKVKRRAFLKVLGSYLVNRNLNSVRDNFLLRNSTIREDVVRAATIIINNEQGSTGHKVFSDYFQTTPEALRILYDNISTITNNATAATTNNDIATKLHDLNISASFVYNNLDAYFDFDNVDQQVPQNLEKALKFTSAYLKIMGYTRQRNTESTSATLNEIVIHALSLCGVAISSEIALEVSDQIFESLIEVV